MIKSNVLKHNVMLLIIRTIKEQLLTGQKYTQYGIYVCCNLTIFVLGSY